ncbi:hypothetical protein ACU610_16790 [Geodermatophilus sp. URMC 61]|uniref:hypothetical protein n=1 Tax=Geodermatophilus sp. URMC 61 TaxID=3423411 RepID=UPI00406CE1DA
MTIIAEGVAAEQSQTESGVVRRSIQVEEPATEHSVITAVIYLLGACALIGLLGVIGLIATKADPSNLAALTALVGSAIGGLATTRTSAPAGSRKSAQGD